MRQLPKSLHTITVIENLTRFLMIAQGLDAKCAMRVTLEALKLSTLPDGYGLAAAALAKITTPTRHENNCDCGRRKVAGAIACSECYARRA